MKDIVISWLILLSFVVLLYFLMRYTKENFLVLDTDVALPSGQNQQVQEHITSDEVKTVDTSYTTLKKILNVDDYTAEKRRISYSKETEYADSPRYWIDEHRNVLISPVPFKPHVIRASYRDVDVPNKILTNVAYLNEASIRNIEAPLDEHDKKQLVQDNYCLKDENKHKEICIQAERKYKCFGKLEFTKEECEDTRDIIGNRVEPGVWDRPCVANEECPFWGANKNYTNTFGACQNGYCELPKGMVRMGYRQYKKSSVPVCYNCQEPGKKEKTMDTCCELQKSPDYVFENDLYVRYKQKDELDAKELTTTNIDSYPDYFEELERKIKARN